MLLLGKTPILKDYSRDFDRSPCDMYTGTKCEDSKLVPLRHQLILSTVSIQILQSLYSVHVQ